MRRASVALGLADSDFNGAALEEKPRQVAAATPPGLRLLPSQTTALEEKPRQVASSELLTLQTK